MLLNEKKQVVIITPMKVGSTTIHNMFQDKPGWIFAMGPHPWRMEKIDKHTHCFPYWVNINRHKMNVLLLIRNPIDRVASFYHHWLMYENHSETISDWMKEQFIPCFNRKKKLHYFSDCTTLYPDHNHVIRIEKLKSDLLKHGIEWEGNVPMANRWPTRTELKEEHKDFVRQVHHSDFVAGEYDAN